MKQAMKTLASYWLEGLIIGGLLYMEHYLWALLLGYLVLSFHKLHRLVDYVRALVRVDVALILEPKLEMLLTAAQVSQESRERYIEQVERELKTRGLWDGLVADAAKIGLSL